MHKFAKALQGRALLFLSLLFLPSLALAFEGRLLRADGSPAAGYRVSVVGLTVTVTTSSEGNFRIVPSPVPPFRLVATGPGGEVSAPIEVDDVSTAGDLTIPAAFEDAVTVAAGVSPNIEAPPAAGTVVLGQENLEQRKPGRLADVLDGVAGVSRTDETTTAVPVIRGLGRGRTLILLDGSRVTTERRAGASASFLDPFTLGAVEVSRGGGSVAYGSDALGGVIHAIPRYPEPGSPALYFQVNQGFGGDDESSAGLDVSRDALGGALQGQFTWRQSDEQEAADGEVIPFSAYEDHSGALRYNRYVGNGQVRAGFYAADADDVGKPASDSASIATTYPKESTRRFNLNYESGPLGTWENVELGVFFGKYRLVTDRDRAAAGANLRQIESSDVDSNDGSLRAVASRELGGGRLLIGSEIVSRFGLEAVTTQDNLNAGGQVVSGSRSLSVEDARQTDGAVFFTYDRPLTARALVSVGLRGDRVETKNAGGFFGDRSTSHDALSGHLALTAGLFKDLTGTLQVSRGFRDPFLSDRYFRGPSGRGFITGNPELDPETSLQYDASLRWAVSGGSVTLYGYHYEIDDLIERFRPERDFFFRNRGKAEVRGLELEAQARLGRGFSLEGAAAVARGEGDDGAPLDDIAATNGSLALRWAGERGFGFVRGLVVMDDDRAGPIEVERPGYSTFDAGAGWRVLQALEVRVVGRNLTDRRYRDSADEVASLARGRSVTVGLVGRY